MRSTASAKSRAGSARDAGVGVVGAGTQAQSTTATTVKYLRIPGRTMAFARGGSRADVARAPQLRSYASTASVATFASTTAAFRLSPASLARFIGEFLKDILNSSSDIANRS